MGVGPATEMSSWPFLKVLYQVTVILGVYLYLSPVVQSQHFQPVNLTSGWGLMQGFQEGSVDIYLGIPYAKPPVGELRWAPPVAPEPLKDIEVIEEVTRSVIVAEPTAEVVTRDTTENNATEDSTEASTEAPTEDTPTKVTTFIPATYNAKEYAPSCPQPQQSQLSGITYKEDCLYLNIFKPQVCI